MNAWEIGLLAATVAAIIVVFWVVSAWVVGAFSQWRDE